MIKLHSKLKNLSTFKLILIALASMYAVQLFITPFYRLYPMNSIYSSIFKLDTFTDFLRVFWAIGIHPIVETLIFQTLIIRVVLVLTKKYL